MQTIVSIPHQKYPARVREEVESKLQQLVKYYDRLVSVRAVVSREGDDHRVELIANVGHGVTLVVDSTGEQLEASVDDALHRMREVLTRHKNKRAQRHRRGGRIGH